MSKVNFSKTAIEVLNRESYVKATEKLVDAVCEIAKEIGNKMHELDHHSLDVNNQVGLHLRTVKANCGYSYTFLAIDSGDSECRSLEDDNSYYYCNDYNAYVRRASNRQFIAFANALPGIINTLSEIEEEQTKQAECADFFQFFEDWSNYQAMAKEAKEDENKSVIL